MCNPVAIFTTVAIAAGAIGETYSVLSQNKALEYSAGLAEIQAKEVARRGIRQEQQFLSDIDVFRGRQRGALAGAGVAVGKG